MATTVWRGYITFGLISVPVRLFRAARSERVSLRKVYSVPQGAASRGDAPSSSADEDEPDEEPRPLLRGRFAPEPMRAPEPIRGPEAMRPPEPEVLVPVRQAALANDNREVLAANKVSKAYEFEKNQFVAITPDELKSIAAKTASEMEILEFVNLTEIDPVYFETSYYVRPEEAGEKAYALLYKALQNAKLVAIAQFAMHNREHVVVLRPGHKGLISHTMYYATEVRGEDEFEANVTSLSAKELELANTLIQSLAAAFEPEKYHDTYKQKLEALIAAKVEGRSTQTAAPAPSRDRVVDIADALRKSLANLKIPQRQEQKITGKPELKKRVKAAK